MDMPLRGLRTGGYRVRVVPRVRMLRVLSETRGSASGGSVVPSLMMQTAQQNDATKGTNMNTEMMLRQALTVMTDRASEELTQRKQAERQRYEAIAGLRQFKEAVRDAVIEAKAEHSLCTEGSNAFLEALGLPPLSEDYAVTGTALYQSTLTLEGAGIELDVEISVAVPWVAVVNAGSQDHAEELAEDLDSDDVDLDWSGADYEMDASYAMVSDDYELRRWMLDNSDSPDMEVGDVELLND